MQVSRSFPRQEEGPLTGGNRQGEHPLHVPRHGNEGPLTLDIFEPTQQELAEAHHRFDDPEHRLRDLLAQGIELLAFGRLQTVAHGFERRRVLRRRRYFGKALRQGRIMRLAALRNHRIDLRRSAEGHVGFAEVTVSASNVSGLPRSSGKVPIRSSIGSICCLSLGAWTTCAAITRRLSAATTAWAL